LFVIISKVVQVPEIEFSRCKVDASHRINLPLSLVRAAGWITGDDPVRAWLVLLSADRCRLLSPALVDGHSQIQAVASRINSELSITNSDPLEIGDEENIALALRLFHVEIKSPQPLRRIALPEPITTAMQLQGGSSHVAALIFRGHIEFWTIDFVRTWANKPIPELL
jgi:hypothetical protein